MLPSTHAVATVPPAYNRRESGLVGRYPWATTTVLSAESFALYLPNEYQAFAQHVQEMEYEIIHCPDPTFRSIRSDLDFPGAASLRAGNNRSLPHCTAYMANLRIVDVLSLLHGGNVAPPIPRQIHFQPSTWMYGSALDSIKDLLSAFRSTQVAQLPLNIDSGDHAPVQHLKTLVFYKRAKAASNIFINMTIAALHLGFCLGCYSNTDFKTYTKKFRDQISVADGNYIETILNREQIYLRRPLYAALHLSPIILLSPKHEIDIPRPYKELDMLQDARVLGNHAVEPLKRAEALIWQSLLDLASGRVRVEEAVHMLQTKLPFDDIFALSDDQDQILRLTHRQINAVGPTSEDSSMDVDTLPPTSPSDMSDSGRLATQQSEKAAHAISASNSAQVPQSRPIVLANSGVDPASGGNNKDQDSSDKHHGSTNEELRDRPKTFVFDQDAMDDPRTNGQYMVGAQMGEGDDEDGKGEQGEGDDELPIKPQKKMPEVEGDIQDGLEVLQQNSSRPEVEDDLSQKQISNQAELEDGKGDDEDGEGEQGEGDDELPMKQQKIAPQVEEVLQQTSSRPEVEDGEGYDEDGEGDDEDGEGDDEDGEGDDEDGEGEQGEGDDELPMKQQKIAPQVEEVLQQTSSRPEVEDGEGDDEDGEGEQGEGDDELPMKQQNTVPQLEGDIQNGLQVLQQTSSRPEVEEEEDDLPQKPINNQGEVDRDGEVETLTQNTDEMEIGSDDDHLNAPPNGKGEHLGPESNEDDDMPVEQAGMEVDCDDDDESDSMQNNLSRKRRRSVHDEGVDESDEYNPESPDISASANKRPDGLRQVVPDVKYSNLEGTPSARRKKKTPRVSITDTISLRTRATTPFARLVYGDEMGIDDETETRQLVVEPLAPEQIATTVPLMTMWDAQGVPHNFTDVKFSDPHDAVLYTELLESAALLHHEGVPPHTFSAKDASVFKILPYDEYKDMSSRDIQAIFRHQHIVVTGFPAPRLPFTRQGISKVANVRRSMTIQDMTASKKQFGRDTQGTLLDLLDCASFEVVKGLNSLDNPTPDGLQDGALSLATDSRAFRTVCDEPEGAKNFAMPLEDKKWSLVATEGAVTENHIDAEGVATVIDMNCGEKLWAVVRPRRRHSPLAFADSIQFDKQTFALDKGTFDKDKYSVEIILLTPGTRLIMRPNTIHAALTMKRSICQGAHFYSLSTMRDTLAGLVHMLTREVFITNTSHPKLRLMIRRVIQYVHMNLVRGETDEDDTHCFDAQSMSKTDFEDLFGVISLGILGNVLDPRTYEHADGDNTAIDKKRMLQYDYNAVPESERTAYTYTRGAAYELISWFSSQYKILPRDGTTLSTDCLILYGVAWEAYGTYITRLVPSAKVQSAPSATKIYSQISGIAIEGSVFHANIIKLLENSVFIDDPNISCTFLYDWSTCDVVQTPDPKHHVLWSNEDIFKAGVSAMDLKYFKGLKVFWAIEGNNL